MEPEECLEEPTMLLAQLFFDRQHLFEILFVGFLQYADYELQYQNYYMFFDYAF